MEPLISMATVLWNAVAPTTWFLVLGLLISLYHSVSSKKPCFKFSYTNNRPGVLITH